VLRSILVALDGSPWSEAATTLALEWARRFDARLIGLGVVDEPSIDRGEPVPMGAYEYKKNRDETRLADAHQRGLGFLDDFRVRSAAARLTATAWRTSGIRPSTSCVRRSAVMSSSSAARAISTSTRRIGPMPRSPRSFARAPGRSS
jgi:nucleotide-binding universal stress UspA family protein